MVISERAHTTEGRRSGAAAIASPAGLRERNKERKREALVRAGRALFQQKGFEETTTRAIAAKAGVASGTFFLYFAEKRDLLFHLFREDVSQVQEEAFATAPPGAPLAERLAHVFGRFYAWYARNPRLSRVFLKELVFLEEDVRHPAMAFTASFVHRLAELVAEAQAKGEVRAGVDATLAASQAMAVYLFVLVAWFNGILPTPAAATAQARAQLALLVDGVGRRRRP